MGTGRDSNGLNRSFSSQPVLLEFLMHDCGFYCMVEENHKLESMFGVGNTVTTVNISVWYGTSFIIIVSYYYTSIKLEEQT